MSLPRFSCAFRYFEPPFSDYFSADAIDILLPPATCHFRAMPLRLLLAMMPAGAFSDEAS
jgi:hypothetical protein